MTRSNPEIKYLKALIDSAEMAMTFMQPKLRITHMLVLLVDRVQESLQRLLAYLTEPGSNGDLTHILNIIEGLDVASDYVRLYMDELEKLTHDEELN